MCKIGTSDQPFLVRGFYSNILQGFGDVQLFLYVIFVVLYAQSSGQEKNNIKS